MEAVAVVAAAFAILLIGVAIGAYLYRPEKPPEGHVHEATTANPGGWFCECGAHKHIPVFAIDGSEKRRCQCGKAVSKKEWA